MQIIRRETETDKDRILKTWLRDDPAFRRQFDEAQERCQGMTLTQMALRRREALNRKKVEESINIVQKTPGEGPITEVMGVAAGIRAFMTEEINER